MGVAEQPPFGLGAGSATPDLNHWSHLSLNFGNGLGVRVHCLIHLAHKFQQLILKVKIQLRKWCGLRLLL
jgi:hypothetical protein